MFPKKHGKLKQILIICTLEAIEKQPWLEKILIQSSSSFKGDLTHTVSPNLMLILSTYRVVLHPLYIQKVFSFVIFIKERYIFTILSRKKPAPGGVPCGRS